MPIADALREAAAASGAQLLALLGPLALAVVALNLSSALLLRAALALFGRRVFLALFGWLGTAVHELSHALFCLLFGHRITELKLFDPRGEGGRLGLVRHAYNPRNPYHQLGNLFIAVAPIAVGTAALTAAALLLLGGGLRAELLAPAPATGGPDAAALGAQILRGAGAIGARVIGGGAPWWGIALFAYLAISIGGLMGMSKEDALGALPGLAAAAILVFLANLGAALFAGRALTPFVWAAVWRLAAAWSVTIAVVAVALAAALALFLIGKAARRGGSA